MQQFLFDYTWGVFFGLVGIFFHCSLAMKDRLFITTLMNNLSTEESYKQALSDKKASQGAATHAMLTASILHRGMVIWVLVMIVLCAVQTQTQSNWMFIFHLMYWRSFFLYGQALARTGIVLDQLELSKAHLRELQRRALNDSFHLFKDQRK